MSVPSGCTVAEIELVSRGLVGSSSLGDCTVGVLCVAAVGIVLGLFSSAAGSIFVGAGFVAVVGTAELLQEVIKIARKTIKNEKDILIIVRLCL